MPVGPQFVALPHHNEALLAIACAAERTLGRLSICSDGRSG
jgi:hypothetical protein